ncbi:MAG: maleylpyruvate isomerase N-terminal domain-containing protein [Ktedonobacteraceae bacterium]|nr:maleylpyruvate isomerase N-terminal domain-containing protein [Ktedonobacteraceae bacterium]
MDKQTFLDTLHGERAQWDAQVAQVSEKQMTQPGFAGEWSLKDVIAHIAVYEEWAANEIQRALRGEQPEWDPKLTEVSNDERNARLYEQQRGRSLSDTLAFSRRTYQQLVEAIQALSDEEFKSTDGLGGRLHPFWAGRPLWKGLVGNAYEHYQEHTPDLKAWLSGQAETGKTHSP